MFTFLKQSLCYWNVDVRYFTDFDWSKNYEILLFIYDKILIGIEDAMYFFVKTLNYIMFDLILQKMSNYGK